MNQGSCTYFVFYLFYFSQSVRSSFPCWKLDFLLQVRVKARVSISFLFTFRSICSLLLLRSWLLRFVYVYCRLRDLLVVFLSLGWLETSLFYQSGRLISLIWNNSIRIGSSSPIHLSRERILRSDRFSMLLKFSWNFCEVFFSILFYIVLEDPGCLVYVSYNGDHLDFKAISAFYVFFCD